jgi:hypothetical protein
LHRDAFAGKVEAATVVDDLDGERAAVIDAAHGEQSARALRVLCRIVARFARREHDV